jgi:hypothetical protein
MSKTVIEAYVEAATALYNCKKHGNVMWEELWESRIEQLTSLLPSGSGLSEVRFFEEPVKSDRVNIHCTYHCMNPDGYYEGYRDYIVTAKPSFLLKLDLIIKGRDYNGIKDWMWDTFHFALTQEAPRYPWEGEV